MAVGLAAVVGATVGAGVRVGRSVAERVGCGEEVGAGLAVGWAGVALGACVASGDDAVVWGGKTDVEPVGAPVATSTGVPVTPVPPMQPASRSAMTNRNPAFSFILNLLRSSRLAPWAKALL
jgi:cell division septation protein DedD